MRTKNFFGFFVIFFSCLIFFLKNPANIFATTCSISSSTISASCSYADTSIYLDAGTGTTNTYQLIVSSGILGLTSGQTLYVGSLKLSGGSVTSVGTTKIVLGTPIWMVDADADGYPASTTKYISQPAGGRRLNLVTHPTTAETCDSAADRNPGETGVWHTTISSDSSWDFDCDGIVTQRYTSPTYLSQKYICNTTGCAAHYYTIKDGWTTSTSTPACGVADTYKKTTGQSSTNCAVLNTVATCANTVTSASMTQGCY